MRQMVVAAVAVVLVSFIVSVGESKAQAGAPRPTDAQCWSDVTRYVDCQNGTVRDQVTGLLWLQLSDCLPATTYSAANRLVAALRSGRCGLRDGSAAGDWRLPTFAEWSATIKQAGVLGCSYPAWTSDDGLGCYGAGPNGGQGGSLKNVAAGAYWSRTTNEAYPSFALGIGLGNPGDVNGGGGDKSQVYNLTWPVRQDVVKADD